VDHFRDYWTVSQLAALTWLPNKTFLVAWCQLNKLKKTVGNHDRDTPLWRGAGTLSLYMLIVDMHAAGLVDAPTVTDVAHIVAKL
jgi:hypothetical protein